MLTAEMENVNLLRKQAHHKAHEGNTNKKYLRV